MPDVTAGHFFAGTVGLSLLRRWFLDGEFNRARMDELAIVLENLDEFPYSFVLNPTERDLQHGYTEWAETYDGPNPLIDAETPVVRPVLDQLGGPGMVALDAACGTGRHAAYLSELGCDTTGIDQSAAMLDVARSKVPRARFQQGDLEELPLDGGQFDLAVISLALCHLADPSMAIAELGRVLRPGGRLVITDPHPSSALVGGQAFYGGIVPGQPMRWVKNHYHHASTWLAAFSAAGLAVDECREVPFDEQQIATNPAYGLFPDATRAAMEGLPSFWLWTVRRQG